MCVCACVCVCAYLGLTFFCAFVWGQRGVLLQRTRLPDVALHRGDLDSTIWVSGDNEGIAHSVTSLDNRAVVYTQRHEQQTHMVGVTTKTKKGVEQCSSVGFSQTLCC